MYGDMHATRTSGSFLSSAHVVQVNVDLHVHAKLCQYMLLYIIIQREKNMVSVIQHIQLSNMGSVPKWSDK